MISKGQKKLYNAVLVFVLLCAIGSAFAVAGYQAYSGDYRRYMSLAQTAIQHLRVGVALLSDAKPTFE
jgi:hypothetical protein